MKKKELFPTILSILFIAVIWHVIAVLIGYPAIFPSIIDLGKQIASLFVSNDFFSSVSNTIFRGIVGFTLSFIFAFILATIALFSKFWKAFIHPILVITRSIPVISFVLIALLWFSPPNLPIFVAIITMLPILYQNTLTGLEQTDLRWIEMAKVVGKSQSARFFSIYLPASKSFIYDGISTSMGFGWRAIIIGEVLAQPLHGIGTSMKQAQAYINVSELIAWTVVAIIVSYVFEYLFRFLRSIKISNKFSPNEKFVLTRVQQINQIKRIRIQNIDKKYNDKTIFNSFTADFDNESVNYIKSPSGRGKTTLFRLITNLEKPDSGKIINENLISIGYSFQDNRLLPWLTVSENIAFVISNRSNKQEISNIVSYLLEKMELSEHRNKFPNELSGGQMQRVNLARSLASKSDLLLLDEPFQDWIAN